jgi:branched-chain amino acid transport system substrate-binding protein
MASTRGNLLASIVLGLSVSTNLAAAEKKYDVGATDNEIKIGNIMPYSGPLSAYALIGRTEAAFFNKINAEGGINGRKINFVTYDDAFSPPKTVEQARKLVESDEVLLIFQSLGTPTNNAIRPYMNLKKVPQLFVATGATQFGDRKSFPWTPRVGFTQHTSCRTCRRRRSAFSTRTTIRVATTSRASRTASALRRPSA